MPKNYRNELAGKVTAVEKKGTLTDVRIALRGGTSLSFTITSTSADKFELVEDKIVYPTVKISSLFPPGNPPQDASSDKIICGTIVSLVEGDESEEMVLQTSAGDRIIAVTPGGTAEKLGLKKGKEACAVCEILGLKSFSEPFKGPFYQPK